MPLEKNPSFVPFLLWAFSSPLGPNRFFLDVFDPFSPPKFQRPVICMLLKFFEVIDLVCSLIWCALQTWYPSLCPPETKDQKVTSSRAQRGSWWDLFCSFAQSPKMWTLTRLFESLWYPLVGSHFQSALLESFLEWTALHWSPAQLVQHLRLHAAAH